VRYDGDLAKPGNRSAEIFVKVVKVFFTEDDAFQEVERLNSLRRTGETEYFVSGTHVHDD
jgi:hypothetical protein